MKNDTKIMILKQLQTEPKISNFVSENPMRNFRKTVNHNKKKLNVSWEITATSRLQKFIRKSKLK